MTDTTDTIVDIIATDPDHEPHTINLPCDPKRISELEAIHGRLTTTGGGIRHPNRLFTMWATGQDPTDLNLLAHAISHSTDPRIIDKLEPFIDARVFPMDGRMPLRLANLAIQSTSLPWHDYTRAGDDEYERYGRTLIDLDDMPDPIRTLQESAWHGCLDMREYGHEAALDRDVILGADGWIDLTEDTPDEDLYTASQLAAELGLSTDDED
ncbi:hypothetical protein CSQ85_12285 [Bifidobacterium rousetti]|uniref:hypothetical protein n=1 Tax=Bifidobacterium rousetti TaxID=2045439 RepID=UPI00123A9EFA|nr:hypothetical protein [Bifidobacterium rousetti]KAA8815700.1 hypothetical protein CSQ85_12285 [Bifidobacterium rousetti]